MDRLEQKHDDLATADQAVTKHRNPGSRRNRAMTQTLRFADGEDRSGRAPRQLPCTT